MIKLTSFYVAGGWPYHLNQKFKPQNIWVKPSEIVAVEEEYYRDFSLIRQKDMAYTKVTLQGGKTIAVQESSGDVLRAYHRDKGE